MNYIIIILLILIIIYLTYQIKYSELFEPIDLETNINNLNSKNKTQIVVNTMMNNIISLLNMHKIKHGISIIRYDNPSIIIMSNDKNKLLSIIPNLYQMGYGFSKYNQEYRIYPLNGRDVTYYNKIQNLHDITDNIEDNIHIDYKYPFVDIFIY